MSQVMDMTAKLFINLKILRDIREVCRSIWRHIHQTSWCIILRMFGVITLLSVSVGVGLIDNLCFKNLLHNFYIINNDKCIAE